MKSPLPPPPTTSIDGGSKVQADPLSLEGYWVIYIVDPEGTLVSHHEPITLLRRVALGG